MATQKSKPPVVNKKPAAKPPAPAKAPPKKPAAKKAVPVKAAAKKAVAKKVVAGKTVAVKATPAKKSTAAKKPVAPAKKVPAAKKPGAPAAARRKAPAEWVDPARQLDKLDPDQPSALPAGARGAPLPRAVGDTGAAMPEGFFSAFTGARLGEADYAAVAHALGCDVASVKAVAEVESRGAPFDAQNRPVILYERHIFARCTVPKGRFDASHPDLSGFRKPYPPGTYGTKDQQYGKLARAYALDPVAALKAPSWGMFQILGENHAECGFVSVVDFVKAMTVSEVEHLKAFARFVAGSAKRLQAIRTQDWNLFALHYNGPDYKTFKYDQKLAAAYAKHAAG